MVKKSKLEQELEDDDVETGAGEYSVCATNWERYEYCISRGHDNYVDSAARLEGFYLGGTIDGYGNLMPGGQWTAADLEVLAAQGRPAYEMNEVRPSINSAIGYQIHNRMDIAFRPAGGGADQLLSDIRSKLAMNICSREKYHYKETQVFSDGLIEQRGYFNVRMRFDDNIQGDVCIEVLDPRDVMPDPDAKTYDPDGWADFMISRWMTAEEIEDWYGKEKRIKVQANDMPEDDYGNSDLSGERNKFGGNAHAQSHARVGGVARYKVLERQQFKYKMCKVAVFPTGDVQVLEDAQPDVIADLTNKGCLFTKKLVKRVYWTITTKGTTIFEDWSPFPFLTGVPYFPYFRRGKSRGMVDIAVGAQQVLNKATSQGIHIVNTTANSGWIVDENSLTNMTTEQLEEQGSQSGLVLEVKTGARDPRKIQPNRIPDGFANMGNNALAMIKEVTVPDAMRGNQGAEVSGVAIQSRQFASQQQLAVVLDNLALTRNMVAARIDWCIANYYTAERVIRVAEVNDQTGKDGTREVVINQHDGYGSYLNDMTIGKYDVVIAEVPMQITFENSQFTQALEIRKAGIELPSWAVVKHSNLSDKEELLSEMRQPLAAPPADPTLEARARLINAQADKTVAEIDATVAKTVQTNIQASFGAIQTGQTIAAIPQTAALADSLLKSAGYKDHDAGTIVPSGSASIGAMPAIQGRPAQLTPQQVAAMQADAKNTSPQFPASASAGMMQGIETPKEDSVVSP